MKKLNICLIGYGRMGKEVEKISIERGHKIFLKLNSEQEWLTNINEFMKSDVAIDFSSPNRVVDNIHKCFDGNIPVVVGTTGWYNQLNEVENWCSETNQSLFHAPNFSVGMNIVFEMNQLLAKFTAKYDYTLSLSEEHHINKKDTPSGTALELAKEIIDQNHKYKGWKIGQHIDADLLPIEVTRRENVSGIHEIVAQSDEDIIILRHEARGLNGFALGAVLAAEFLYGKKGIFTIKDLLHSVLNH